MEEGYLVSKEEPKQETFEEAELKTLLKEATNQTTCASERMGFINGAKWQQERMYSEEELLEFANWCRIQDNKYPNCCRTIQQLFTQFKKK
jgi:hypothetical protein